MFYLQTASCRVNENPAKIDQLHDEQMECEKKLEKERDIWASEMFEVIAEEEMVANYVMSYISHQKAYHRSALNEIEIVMKQIDSFMSEYSMHLLSVTFLLNKTPFYILLLLQEIIRRKYSKYHYKII